MAALDLQCVGGDVESKVCQLIEATFHVSVGAVSRGAVEGTATCQLIRDGGNAALVIGWHGPETHRVSLPLLNLVDDWAGMYVHFGVESSLFQPIDAGSTYSASWGITLRYQCVDSITGEVTERIVEAVNLGTDTCEDNRTFVRAVAVGGQGGGSATQYNSSPVSGGGCFVDLGNFYPRPEVSIVNLDASQGICLHATGGTPPYQFFIISGKLPCGETLNQSTGCIEGTPDGTCEGTDEITFQVFDSVGDHDEVTCGFPKAPCGVNITPPPADLLFEGLQPGVGLYVPLAELIFDGLAPSLSVNSCGGGFDLMRIVVSMRPATHAPVRGSAT